jgi:hypothetical protein
MTYESQNPADRTMPETIFILIGETVLTNIINIVACLSKLAFFHDTNTASDVPYVRRNRAFRIGGNEPIARKLHSIVNQIFYRLLIHRNDPRLSSVL